jgi:hypothetical protein
MKCAKWTEAFNIKNRVNIYYPKTTPTTPKSQKFPLLSFAHGFSQGGRGMDITYRKRLFEPIVSRGYVVIAHQSGGALDYCETSDDQLHAISWARGEDKAGLLRRSLSAETTDRRV